MNYNQERTGAATALVDLFNRAKQNFAASTSCATLAKVASVTKTFSDGYGIAEVIPIPAWDSADTYTLDGYFFSDMALTADTLVMVVFTDSDFRETIKSGIQVIKTTQNTNNHSRNFGVILKL
uniref:Uncharacterized protein n=1 Tax=Myoviridae sp. ctj3P51 TaxID=2826687 RepID=A0A8S5NNZ3_9CAUD|nr:MAG TPA: hypothetical protein [Myoviridae sp. ctj3P51]